MIHARHGMYESAQMEPIGSVEETGNTVVDVMGCRDEMIMKGGGTRAESKMREQSVGEGNSSGDFLM